MLGQWCAHHHVPERRLLDTLHVVGVETFADLLLVEPDDLVAAGFDPAQASVIVRTFGETEYFQLQSGDAQL